MADQSPKNGLEESVRERLVAYLDGELSDKESQAIERQLSSDDQLRSELQGLDQAWNALDALPVETAGNDFTKSTIAMVVDDVKQQAKKEQSVFIAPMRHVGRWGRYAAYACLIGLGFLSAVMITSYRDRQLLRDLPEILHAHTLSQVGDLEFLQAWSERSDQLTNILLTDSLKEESSTWTKLQSMPAPTRYRWVDELPPDQLSELSDESRAFQSLSDSKKDKLRSLSAAINDSSNAEALREDALLYQSFVSRLSATEQVILRELPSDERIERVMKELKRSQRPMRMELSELEEKKFRLAIEDTIKAIQSSPVFAQSKLINQLMQKRGSDGNSKKFTDAQQAQRHLAFVLWVSATSDSRVEMMLRKPVRVVADRVRTNWEKEWMPILLDGLPKRVSQHVRSQKDVKQQTRLLGSLIRETVLNTTKTDASKYFAEELTKKEQLRYLAMPVDQMQEELNERAAAETFGGASLDNGPDFRPGLPPERGSLRPPGPPRGRPDFNGPRGPNRDLMERPPHGKGPGGRRPPPPERE